MAQLSHGCQVDQDAALAAKAVFRGWRGEKHGKKIPKLGLYLERWLMKMYGWFFDLDLIDQL